MFGKIPKKRGLFDPPQSTYDPQRDGIGGGMMQASPVGMAMPQQQTPEPQSPGFFGQGGAGRAIAGTIGDFLLQNAEMDPIYAPQMQQQQALAARQRMASLEREQDWQDYLRKQEYERANPKPEIDLREDNAGNVWKFDARTGQPLGDAPTWVDKTPKEFVHEGMRFSIPNPYAQSAGGSPDMTPTSEDGYNYTPGPGGRANPANWKQAAGGGVSNDIGNFRDAFAEYAR